MKQCSRCGEEKAENDFKPDLRNRDGLQSQCVSCQRKTARESKRRNYEKNKAKQAERKKAWHEKNRDAVLSRKAKYRESKRSELQEKQKEFRTKNPEYQKQWRENNRDKLTEYERDRYYLNKPKYFAAAAKRRASRKQATPTWPDSDMSFLVQEAYALARLRSKMLGGVWHVDHVLPLKGKTVCGLHVPWNLQVIPALDNLRKGNKVFDGQQSCP